MHQPGATDIRFVEVKKCQHRQPLEMYHSGIRDFWTVEVHLIHMTFPSAYLTPQFLDCSNRIFLRLFW